MCKKLNETKKCKYGIQSVLQIRGADQKPLPFNILWPFSMSLSLFFAEE